MKKFIASLFLLCGCASINVVSRNKIYPPKPDDCSMQVLSAIPAGYEEIAQIQGVNGSDINFYIEAAKITACRFGGDAVVIMNSSNTPAYVNGGFVTSTNSTMFSILRKQALSK